MIPQISNVEIVADFLILALRLAVLARCRPRLHWARRSVLRKWYSLYMKKLPTDKKKVLREMDHLTRPPRLEGKAKNAGLNPIRKKTKNTRTSEGRKK